MTKKSKEKILETASRLFYIQGFHGTGLNQIIKESGAPKGSIYHYFPNGKEQLAEEAILLSKERIGAAIQHYMSKYDLVEDALLAHIQAMADLFNQDNGIEERSYTIMPFALLAVESAFMSERLQQVSDGTYKYWESIYFSKLLANHYTEEQSMIISKAISALIEGAVTISLAQKSNDSLLNLRHVIPKILKQ